MASLKYSRQREAIKEFLAVRTDHPTADTVYTNLREKFPNISLGTVYRNLALLAERGEILKITTGDTADHFDGHTAPHHHFICRECQRLMDLDMENIDSIITAAGKNFGGKISSYTVLFHGVCEDCMKNHELSKNT